MSPPVVGATESVPVAADVLAILACPACESRPPVAMSADGQQVQCTVCARRYPVMPNGIPVMLVEEALPPPAA